MTGLLRSMDDALKAPSGFPFSESDSCTREPREFFSFVRRAIPRWGFQKHFRILMLLVIPASAADESEYVVVTRCTGPSIGRAIFYRTSPEARTRWGEWEKDDLASVAFSLVYRDGDPDILYRESKSGELKSYKEDGFRLGRIQSADPNFHVILAIYPTVRPPQQGGAILHYLFRLDKHGNGDVAWGKVSSDLYLHRNSLYRSKCISPIPEKQKQYEDKFPAPLLDRPILRRRNVKKNDKQAEP